MQLNLGFLKDLRRLTDPRLDPDVWAGLEDEQRIAVLDVLERLIVQAAGPEPEKEDDDE